MSFLYSWLSNLLGFDHYKSGTLKLTQSEFVAIMKDVREMIARPPEEEVTESQFNAFYRCLVSRCSDGNLSQVLRALCIHHFVYESNEEYHQICDFLESVNDKTRLEYSNAYFGAYNDMLKRVIVKCVHFCALQELIKKDQPLAFGTIYDIIKFYKQFPKAKSIWRVEEIDNMLSQVGLTDSQAYKIDNLLISSDLIGISINDNSNLKDIPYLNRITIPNLDSTDTLYKIAVLQYEAGRAPYAALQQLLNNLGQRLPKGFPDIYRPNSKLESLITMHLKGFRDKSREVVQTSTETEQTSEMLLALFNDLPRDVFLEIFSYLSASELTRISLVCKLWKTHSFEEKLWKNLLELECRKRSLECSTSINYRITFMNTFAKEIYRSTLARKQGVLEAGIGAAILYKNYERYMTADILKNVQKILYTLKSAETSHNRCVKNFYWLVVDAHLVLGDECSAILADGMKTMHSTYIYELRNEYRFGTSPVLSEFFSEFFNQ